jgi:DNA repair exonuclease SbcCD ATPase subunit
MEKLTVKKKLTVVGKYLSGMSYDEIALKTGISKGMVANIVAELKGGSFPEAADVGEQIELFRELSVNLKHSGLTPGQCAVGLAVLNRINECGLNAADIGRWPDILKAAGSEQNAKEFVETVYRIQEVQKKTGLTLEEADNKLHELEVKAAELEPVTKQLEEYRKGITELTKRRDELINLVDKLDQKYGVLNPRVKDLEKRESELSRRIKDEEEKTEKAEATLATWSKEKQRLQEAGFSLEALVEFNDRTRAIAERHHIDVSGLRDRLLYELESLDKGLGFETLIQGKEAELRTHQEAITSAKKKHEGLKATITTLEQQKTALETSIKATRKNVSDEIAKVIPMAKETISQLTKELRLGNETILDDVRHLKDQALEVGKEIGRYEGIVKVNEWLFELLSLSQGKEDLEAKRVRTILLLVLRGGQSWMKQNQAEMGYSTISYTIGRLIEELEQWQI